MSEIQDPAVTGGLRTWIGFLTRHPSLSRAPADAAKDVERRSP